MAAIDNNEIHWHTQSAEDVAHALNTCLSQGLSSSKVLERRPCYGYNELSDNSGPTWVKILLRQFADVMNWIFAALGIVSFVFSDYPTGAMLLMIAMLNLYLTFSQEYAAEKTLTALRHLSSPTAQVIRDGREQMIESRELVPGDILVIKEGDSVAADARLFHVSNLEVDEALLTGESVPVHKDVIKLTCHDEPLGDRVNMVYSSTLVSKGRGCAVVTAVGMKTEIGKVATTLKDTGEGDRTRLQKSLNKMYILLMCLAVVFVIIVLASVRFKADYTVGTYAMTAALSVLPSGLTTVMTVTLVLGGKEMAQQKAVVRRLKCLETLGSVTNIFSDKTGTLTMAKMVVVRVWMPDNGFFYVSSNGHAPEGDLYRTKDLNEQQVSPRDRVDLHSLPVPMSRLAQCAALCNMASLFPRQQSDNEKRGEAIEPDDWVSSGAPTEVALQVFAHKLGKGKPALVAAGWELMAEYPFDSTIKRMSTLYRDKTTGNVYLFTKGAAEQVMALCPHTCLNPETVIRHVEAMAALGLRVIALAYRKVDMTKVPSDADIQHYFTRHSIECDLNLLGLTGIHDPPRAESRQAVQEAHRAGISVHMLTGDHEITARVIAKEIHILDKTLPDNDLDKLVMTGPQFDAMSDESIDQLAHLPRVVARCSPDTKVKMIRAARRRRYISAMTGDGVNDSPSLRIADVGIAMGKNGSDVAKQASDVILTDDNFATIIRAIAEGRRIYQNMQRFLLYYWILLAALAAVVLLCLAVRDPMGKSVAPLSTLQMILIYVAVTPPSADLSVQPASPTIMLEPPRPPTESIFNKEIILDTFFYTLGILVVCVVAYLVPLYTLGDGVGGVQCDVTYQAVLCDSFYRARGSMLVAFLLGSLVVVVHCRSYRRSEWDLRGLQRTLHSRTLICTLVFDVVCLVLFMYVPTVAVKGFSMLGITWEWGMALGLNLLLVAYGEVYKALKRRFLKPLERSVTTSL